MALQYRTKGLIFNKKDRMESDRIFSAFTEDFGKIEVVGKAIRKISSKLKQNIEMFSLSEIEFVQGKNRKTLTDAVISRKFKSLSSDPDKFEIANRISKIIDEFIKGEEKDESIWNFITDIFKKLDDCNFKSHKYYIVYYYFLWNFVSVLGHKPEIYNCSLCGQKLNPYGIYFSNKNGGTICKSCNNLEESGVKVKSDTIKILRLILNREWQTLLKIKTEDFLKSSLKDISSSYYSYLLSVYGSDLRQTNQTDIIR